MNIYPLIDPFAIHYDTFAGDVYTLDTASITLTAGTLTAAALKATGLTSARVVFAGAGGLLSDDAGLTYDSGTNALTVTGDVIVGGEVRDVASDTEITFGVNGKFASTTSATIQGVGGTVNLLLGIANPSFTFTSGTIISSTGAIAFGDENLSTTGTFQATGNITSLAQIIGDDFLHTGSTQDFLFTHRAGLLALQGQSSGQANLFELYTKDGDGTDATQIVLYGVGIPTDITPSENIKVGWDGATNYVINTQGLNGGTVQPLQISTGANGNQILLGTDGLVGINVSATSQFHVVGPIGSGSNNATDVLTVTGGTGGAGGGDGADINLASGTGGAFQAGFVGDGGKINLILGPAGAGGGSPSDGILRIGDGVWTNYLKVERDGDTYWVGAGTGLPYAEAQQEDGSTFNVTMTTVNVWVEVDAATTNITAPEKNLVTFPDDHYLLCQKAGHYLVTYSFTAEINSVAGGDQHVESGIMVNDSIQVDKGLGHEQYAATNKERNLQGHTIIDVPTNGQVSLAIKNTTSSGKILTIDHLNITVTQVGGT